MAAEAEHVSPGPQAPVRVQRVEPPAGLDEAASVVRHLVAVKLGEFADAAVQGAGALGGLGRVLGHVGRDSLFGDVGAVPEGLHGPHVELGAPAEGTGRLVLGGRDGDRGVGVRGSCSDGVSEEADRGPGGRSGLRSVGAVDADHGMKVQRTALLELGDLAVRKAGALLQVPLCDAGAGGDLAAEPVGEALPELPGMVVEQHGTRVVVGGRVQGGAQFRGVCGVAGAAAACAVVGPVVHATERGGGERGEDARVVADGGGDVASVVSSQARADQVVGVARVGPGAGGAARSASVAACDAKASARLVGGGVVVQGLAGDLVLVEGPAGEVDGVGAAAGAADLLVPAVVVRGRSHPQQVAEGGRVEQVRHVHPPGRGGRGRCPGRCRPGRRW